MRHSRALVHAVAATALLVTGLTGAAAAQLPPGVTRDPDRARFSYADLIRFRTAFDRLRAVADTAGLLGTAYFERATDGLRVYSELYDVTGASLRDAIRRHPERYTRASRAGPRIVRAIEDDVRAAYRRLRELYPQALFPTTYYLVGPHRAGGAVQREGILIAVETYASVEADARSSGADRAGLALAEGANRARSGLVRRAIRVPAALMKRTNGARPGLPEGANGTGPGPAAAPDGAEPGRLPRANGAASDRLRDLVHLVAHELVHYQQAAWNVELYQRSSSLLARAINEGTADFVAELISGDHVNAAAHAYGMRHERELWRRFREEMAETGTGDWFFVDPEHPDWPQDLGYFIGYRIARARFERESDPAAGIAALLRVDDYEAFLEESGYGTGR